MRRCGRCVTAYANNTFQNGMYGLPLSQLICGYVSCRGRALPFPQPFHAMHACNMSLEAWPCLAREPLRVGVAQQTQGKR